MTTMLKVLPPAVGELGQMETGVIAGRRPGVGIAPSPDTVAMTVNSVRMTPALEARLAEVAGRLRMSKSDVIRQALGEFLDRLEPVPSVLDIEAYGFRG